MQFVLEKRRLLLRCFALTMSEGCGLNILARTANTDGSNVRCRQQNGKRDSFRSRHGGTPLGLDGVAERLVGGLHMVFSSRLVSAVTAEILPSFYLILSFNLSQQNNGLTDYLSRMALTDQAAADKAATDQAAADKAVADKAAADKVVADLIRFGDFPENINTALIANNPQNNHGSSVTTFFSCFTFFQE
jgi:hypothetical protein